MPTPAAWTTAAAATLRQEQKMTDPTSAERPTQEVAPLCSVCGTQIANPGMSRAEASRSAPPAAVTAEQLAEALHVTGREGRWPHGTTVYVEGECDRCYSMAAAILPKITPAQPSASSEGDVCNALDFCILPKGHEGKHETNYARVSQHPDFAVWQERSAAKPTGSADEPLLRAALERIVAWTNWKEQPRNGMRINMRLVNEEARAALASAEPAEVDE